MAQHRLITPAQCRRMPWRNGAGRTTEILSHPAGAALDAFDWRASVADVVKDSPFSRFAGIDRIVVVVAGAGMRLVSAGQEAQRCAPYEPYAFSGDDAIDCALLDGPVRCFNLMLRRQRTRGSVVVVRGAAVRVAPARFRLCYAVTGACECLLAGHAPLAVPAEHALLVDGEEAAAAPLPVNPLTADAAALVCVVDPVA